ncbi:MAG: tRNA (adenosine(37)-N6)-dimethylallyltransferase MiaA [Methyloceanibacter sp.]|uniref:tRNA (adenosine(37)-N6)-dimethylallyltransferase MiaA n=1 Tax=Methyloceanibacter sp. TaxID=1965321 RepID=UPI003D6C7AFE
MRQGIDAVLIAGPTASGKSAAALAMAKRLGDTIINADSMQVYRELAVLTARPSPDEMTAVPHRIYGTVPASQAYSVGRWLEDASAAIAEARSEGRVPILAGGTGLYFKALLEGLSPIPDIPPETRAFWRERSESLGTEGLYRELASRDPVMAAQVRPTDPQRIVRALEVIDATGVSLAQWQGAEGSPMLRSDTVLKLVVAPERDVVYRAIDSRFDRMIAAGALDEVDALMALDLDPGLPAMRAHGVRELAAYLAGAMTLDEAAAKAKTETRRYAKRQMTWLKRFMADWVWVPDADAAIASVSAELSPSP